MTEFVTKFIMTYLRGVTNWVLKLNRLLIPLFVYFRFTGTITRGFGPYVNGTCALSREQCTLIIVALVIVSLVSHFVLMFCGKDENNDR